MADYSHLTIMYSLPRSMTQWWRWFFSHGCHSVHDPLARCRHPDQLKKVVDAAEGERMFVADTSAVFFHQRLADLLPGHRRLYMMRNVDDVIVSLRQQHVATPVAALVDMHERLLKHAYGEDRNTRIHYGCVRRLDELFELVTGQTVTPPNALQHVVDVPLRQQYRDPASIRSLMAYKDPK